MDDNVTAKDNGTSSSSLSSLVVDTGKVVESDANVPVPKMPSRRPIKSSVGNDNASIENTMVVDSGANSKESLTNEQDSDESVDVMEEKRDVNDTSDSDIDSGVNSSKDKLIDNHKDHIKEIIIEDKNVVKEEKKEVVGAVDDDDEDATDDDIAVFTDANEDEIKPIAAEKCKKEEKCKGEEKQDLGHTLTKSAPIVDAKDSDTEVLDSKNKDKEITPPVVPTKTSSRIAAFQKLLQKQQEEENNFVKSSSPPKITTFKLRSWNSQENLPTQNADKDSDDIDKTQQSVPSGSNLNPFANKKSNFVSNLNGILAGGIPGMGGSPNVPQRRPMKKSSTSDSLDKNESPQSDGTGKVSNTEPVAISNNNSGNNNNTDSNPERPFRRARGPKGRKLPSQIQNVEKIEVEKNTTKVVVLDNWSISFTIGGHTSKESSGLDEILEDNPAENPTSTTDDDTVLKPCEEKHISSNVDDVLLAEDTESLDNTTKDPLAAKVEALSSDKQHEEVVKEEDDDEDKDEEEEEKDTELIKDSVSVPRPDKPMVPMIIPDETMTQEALPSTPEADMPKVPSKRPMRRLQKSSSDSL